jgi:hypothetical protein
MSDVLALHVDGMRPKREETPHRDDEAKGADVESMAETPLLAAWAEVGTFRGCVLVTIAILCARILRRVIARLQSEVGS